MRRVSGTGLWDTGSDGTGQPVELETVWTLSKRGKVAACVLLTHQLGWELRIDSGDLLLTQVCRSGREIQEVSAAWNEAMLAMGWTADVSTAGRSIGGLD